MEWYKAEGKRKHGSWQEKKEGLQKKKTDLDLTGLQNVFLALPYMTVPVKVAPLAQNATAIYFVCLPCPEHSPYG